MPALTRQTYLMAKVETAAGTETAPASTDAVVVYELNFQPISESTTTERLPLTGAIGATEIAVAGAFAGSVQCKTYLSGSGTAGTAPPWAKLMIGCGWQQDWTLSTSVVFKPATAYLYQAYTTTSDYLGMATLTLHALQGTTGSAADSILWKLKGCMGDWTLDAEMGKPITLSLDFKGVHVAPVHDTAWGAPTLTGHQTPPAFMGASCTWTPSAGSPYTMVLRKLQVKGGNKVILRPDANDTNGYKSALIVDRAPTYSMEVELPDDFDAADDGANWYGHLKQTSEAFGKLEFGALGSGSGNVMQFDMDKVGVSKVTQTDGDGIQILNIEGYLATTALATGGDEFDLTFT